MRKQVDEYVDSISFGAETYLLMHGLDFTDIFECETEFELEDVITSLAAASESGGLGETLTESLKELIKVRADIVRKEWEQQ